jgi:hypothetical protein
MFIYGTSIYTASSVHAAALQMCSLLLADAALGLPF